jgi:hypothetical protein
VEWSLIDLCGRGMLEASHGTNRKEPIMHPAFGVAFRCVFEGRADEATLDRFIDFVESAGGRGGA